MAKRKQTPKAITSSKAPMRSTPPTTANVHHGAPTKYNEERHKKVITALKCGNYLFVAAKYAGVDPDTVNSWVKRGRAGEPMFIQFATDFDESEVTAEALAVESISKAYRAGDWRAAMAFLERRKPKRWGEKSRAQLEVSGPEGGPIETSDVDYSQLSVSQLRQLRELRLKAKKKT